MASVGALLQEVRLEDSQVRLQGSTGSIEYQLNNEGDEVGYRDAAACVATSPNGHHLMGHRL